MTNPLTRLQSRVIGGTSLILDGLRDAKSLRRALGSRLARAFDDGILIKDPTSLVWQKQKQIMLSGTRVNAIAVLGGVEINRKRDPTLDHFERADGAWFDFHIEVRPYDGEIHQYRGDLELLGYGYEIRFPPELGCSIPWLRFDLNNPGHPNEARNIRAHSHPGDEDLQAPSPVLHPEEALELLLSDLLRLPEKRRRAASAS